MNSQIDTRIKLKRDTTVNWNTKLGFIPLEGEVIIYTDYIQSSEGNIPNIKIGDGKAYVQDLPFVDKDLRDRLMDHINNLDIHVTLGDKEFWNQKVNIDDSLVDSAGILENENLIFSRTYYQR